VGKEDVLVTVTSKSSKVQQFSLDGAVLGKDIKEGAKVEKADHLFTNLEGEKITAPFNGEVEMRDGAMLLRGRGKDVREYHVPPHTTLLVKDGDVVSAGSQLTEGHLNVQHLFQVAGVRAVQRYILREVQQVYAIQGEAINDKHLEIIVRQMLSRMRIRDAGDTDLLPGKIVEMADFRQANAKAETGSQRPAIGEQLLLGITKVSLTTSSFLAAASFMETARVLIDAAVTGKEDQLVGLKENVIIGKLIPVGTGKRA